MPIEEQAEEKIQNAVQSIITGGARLMLRIPKGVALAMLRSGMELAKTGVRAAGTAVKDGIDSGEMSEKRLQRKKDGDLHELQLDDSTMRETGSSARPPPTRACATSSTPSCATTTGRARKPRSRTVRRHPSQAGRRRQRSRKTNRNQRRPRPGRRPSNSRHRPEQTIPNRPTKSKNRSRSGRRRHCSNGSRPDSTRTSPNRRTTCHPPRTGTARPARAAERKPQ